MHICRFMQPTIKHRLYEVGHFLQKKSHSFFDIFRNILLKVLLYEKLFIAKDFFLLKIFKCIIRPLFFYRSHNIMCLTQIMTNSADVYIYLALHNDGA